MKKLNRTKRKKMCDPKGDPHLCWAPSSALGPLIIAGKVFYHLKISLKNESNLIDHPKDIKKNIRTVNHRRMVCGLVRVSCSQLLHSFQHVAVFGWNRCYSSP